MSCVHISHNLMLPFSWSHTCCCLGEDLTLKAPLISQRTTPKTIVYIYQLNKINKRIIKIKMYNVSYAGLLNAISQKLLC